MPHFRTSDGLNLACYAWHPEQRTPGLPPVLLQHGFASSAHHNFVATGIVAALLAAGREVLAVDARGHGGSDAPVEPDRYGEKQMALDLVELLHRLRISRIDVLGYSMGAVVGLLLCLHDPRVRRLVIGGVGAGVIDCGGLDTRLVPGEAIAEALLANDPAAITHPGAAAYRAFVDATGAHREALAAHALALHRAPPELSRIQVPTLLIAGHQDALAKDPERLAAALPRARCERLAGDHLTVFRQPRLAQLVVAFLGVAHAADDGSDPRAQ